MADSALSVVMKGRGSRLHRLEAEVAEDVETTARNRLAAAHAETRRIDAKLGRL